MFAGGVSGAGGGNRGGNRPTEKGTRPFSLQPPAIVVSCLCSGMVPARVFASGLWVFFCRDPQPRLRFLHPPSISVTFGARWRHHWINLPRLKSFTCSVKNGV
jgi:hypothetical protein